MPQWFKLKYTTLHGHDQHEGDSVSESRNQFRGIDDFVARTARDAVVAAALKDALRALQLIRLAGVEVVGQAGVLDFGREIDNLKVALAVMGVEDAAGG